MSEIDSTKHIPRAQCNLSGKLYFVYEVLEDVILSDIEVRKGRWILGGGNGESSMLTFNIVDSVKLFSDQNRIDEVELEELIQCTWSPNEAYQIGKEIKKIGWNEDEKIEFWFARHIVKFIIENCPQEFESVIGSDDIEINESIFVKAD